MSNNSKQLGAVLVLTCGLLVACEATRYDVDFVIEGEQTLQYSCQEDELCNTGSGYWWPQPGECSSWTDVGVPANTADCDLDVEFSVEGTVVPSSTVVSGNAYDVRVGGCGHSSEFFAILVPALELTVNDVAREEGNIVVDYSSVGASVVQLQTTAGFGALGAHCSREALASSTIASTQRNPVTDAKLSAFADFELIGNFGSVRIWIGKKQFLNL